MNDNLSAFAIYLISAVGLASLLRLKDRDTLIPLILLGMLLSFVPSLTKTQLHPEVVMVFFLVPLVFGSAMVASLRDLMKVGLPVVMMSMVPVALSVLTVGYTAHAGLHLLTALIRLPPCHFLTGSTNTRPPTPAVSCLFLMAVERDEQGRDVERQIADVIGG